MKLKSMALFASLFCILTSVAQANEGGQPARKQWNKNHPRRAEVNKRLRNQERKVDKDLAKGKLTQEQADKIKAEDQSIRKEEQVDAAKHGGHITREEQRKLNREENQVRREIRKDEKINRKTEAGASATAPTGTQ